MDIHKINRLEQENLRLRSLLVKERQTNQLLAQAINKSNIISRIIKKIFG